MTTTTTTTTTTTNFLNVNHTNHEAVEKEKNTIDVRDFELINEKYEMEKVIRRPSSALPKSPTVTSEEMDQYSDMFKDMPLTEETTCGISCFRSSFLQKFANKKVYVLLYGLLGCFNSATYAYFNGTITSLEKRFRISSRTTGKFSPTTSVRYNCSSATVKKISFKSIRLFCFRFDIRWKRHKSNFYFRFFELLCRKRT